MLQRIADRFIAHRIRVKSGSAILRECVLSYFSTFVFVYTFAPARVHYAAVRVACSHAHFETRSVQGPFWQRLSLAFTCGPQYFAYTAYEAK